MVQCNRDTHILLYNLDMETLAFFIPKLCYNGELEKKYLPDNNLRRAKLPLWCLGCKEFKVLIRFPDRRKERLTNLFYLGPPV